MSSTSIAQIDAFVNLVSPATPGKRIELPSKQTVSKTSTALFKTSKRNQHDKTLSKLLEQAKKLKSDHEKLESSSLFLQHELMAQKQALGDFVGGTSDEDTNRLVSEKVPSHQLAICLQRRRVGIV